jgi:hypothetical protein
MLPSMDASALPIKASMCIFTPTSMLACLKGLASCAACLLRIPPIAYWTSHRSSPCELQYAMHTDTQLPTPGSLFCSVWLFLTDQN